MNNRSCGTCKYRSLLPTEQPCGDGVYRLCGWANDYPNWRGNDAEESTGNPAGEERRTDMDTYKVLVKEHPCQKEIEAGAEVQVIYSQDDIPAIDPQAAAFIAGRTMGSEKKVRQTLLRVKVVPFGG